MNVRYSVFLSSTFEDLKEIRKELSYELFMNGYMVNNMESFGARNGSVWEVIKESIADSDMLVMVIAGRYGSINPDEGISFTEQEYNYAIENGIPVLVFIRDKNAISMADCDTGEKKQKLDAFIKRITDERMVNFWTDTASLRLAVLASLNTEKNNQSVLNKGWIKNSAALEAEYKTVESKLKSVKTELIKADADTKRSKRPTETVMNYYHVHIKIHGSVMECEQGQAVVTYTGSALVDAPEYPVVYRDRVRTGFGIQHQQFLPEATVRNKDEFRRNPILLDYEIKGSESDKLFFTGEIVTNAQLRKDIGGTGLHIPYFAEYVAIELDISAVRFFQDYNGKAFLQSGEKEIPIKDVQFCTNSGKYVISAKNVPANANIMFKWNNVQTEE
ncbi:MAG: DUF4062 domain-containing protein [Treponemataceae bacterium]|nr:DUF4062 domain-containing protein [Treponemataceae bacterium]